MMVETLTIELPEDVSAQVGRMAQALGVSSAELIARLATEAAQSQMEADTYFAARASSPDVGAALRLFSPDRIGGEPPRPEDELA